MTAAATREEHKRSMDGRKRSASSNNTSNVKLRLDPLHTLHTNPFIYSSLYHASSSSLLVKSVSTGTGSAAAAVAMTSQNAKALKRKQRLARSILHSSNSNSNIKGNPPEVAETSYLFGNTACCVAWAPNAPLQSLRRKNVHLLAVATPYNALNVMGSTTDHGDHTLLVMNDSSSSHEVSSSQVAMTPAPHAGNSNLDPSSSIYILVFDESTFHKDANVSVLREMADLLGIPPPSKPLVYAAEDSSSEEYRKMYPLTNQGDGLSSQSSESIEKIGIFRRNIFQHTLQRNKYNEDTSIHQSSSLLSSTSLEGKTFWESLKIHLGHEINHLKQVFLYELFSDGRLLSQRPDHSSISPSPFPSPLDADRKLKDESINNPKSVSSFHASNPNSLKPVLVFQISLPSTGSSNAMEICGLEWNEDGSALSIVQRRKGGTTFVSVTNPASANVLTSTNASLTSTVHTKKKKGQHHHALLSSFNQSSLSGHTATSFWHVPDWLYTHYEEELFNKDGGILGLIGLGGDLGPNTSTGENPLAGMHQDLIIRQSPDGRYADDESDEDDGKTSFPLWDWYLSQYVLKDRDLGAMLGVNVSQHSKDPSTIHNTQTSMYSRILLRNMVESYASPMELIAPPPSSIMATGTTGKPKKTILKTASSYSTLANGDVTCILWEKHTQSLNNQNETFDSMNDAHNSDRRDLAAKMKNPRSSTWIALCTTKGQVILHNTAASCVSHFLKRRAQSSSSSASIAQAIDISSSLQNRSVDVPCKIKKRITCGVWMDNLLVLATIGSGQLTLVHTYSREAEMPEILSVASEKRHIVSNMIIDDACSERCANLLGEISLPGGRDAIDMAVGTAEYDYGGHTTTVLSVSLEGRALAFYRFPKLPNSGASTVTGPMASQAVEISFAMPNSSSPNDLADDSFLLSSYRTMSNPRNETGVSCGNIMKHFLVPNTSLVLVSFISGYFALVDWENATMLSDAEVVSKRGEAESSDSGHTWEDDPFLLDVAFHQPTLTFACLTLTGHIVVMRVRVLVGSHGLKPTDCICSSGLTINRKVHTRQARSTSNPSSGNTQIPVWKADPIKDHPVLSTIDTICSRRIDHVPGAPMDARKGWLLSFSPDGECLSVAAGDEAVYTMYLREDDTENKKLASAILDAVFQGFDRRFYVTAIIVLLYLAWLIAFS